MRPPLAILALVLAAACGHLQPPPAPSGARAWDRAPGLPEGLAAARAGYVVAWEGSDRARLASFFADDARVVFAEQTWEGRARIEEGWLAEDVGKVSDLVMVPERVEQRGGEVTESGTATLRFHGESGVRAERATYEHVWARQPDGTWKLRSVRMDSHPAPQP